MLSYWGSWKNSFRLWALLDWQWCPMSKPRLNEAEWSETSNLEGHLWYITNPCMYILHACLHREKINKDVYCIPISCFADRGVYLVSKVKPLKKLAPTPCSRCCNGTQRVVAFHSWSIVGSVAWRLIGKLSTKNEWRLRKSRQKQWTQKKNASEKSLAVASTA